MRVAAICVPMTANTRIRAGLTDRKAGHLTVFVARTRGPMENFKYIKTNVGHDASCPYNVTSKLFLSICVRLGCGFSSSFISYPYKPSPFMILPDDQ